MKLPVKLPVFYLAILVPFVSACGSASEKTFAENFAEHEALFNHVDTNQSITPVAALTGSAHFTGVMGMTIDVDGLIDADPTAPGGDFRAAGDLAIDVDFGIAQSLSGTVSNFTADEGKNLSGSLTISSTGLTGNTFPATFDGLLMLDGSTLDVTGGTFTNGQFKGPAGEFIWGNHAASVDWAGPGGDPSGGLSGGFIGQRQ